MLFGDEITRINKNGCPLQDAGALSNITSELQLSTAFRKALLSRRSGDIAFECICDMPGFSLISTLTDQKIKQITNPEIITLGNLLLVNEFIFKMKDVQLRHTYG